VTFHAPADARYAFKAFYDKVRDKGFVLYPGKLTQLETFRSLVPGNLQRLLEANLGIAWPRGLGVEHQLTLDA